MQINFAINSLTIETHNSESEDMNSSELLRTPRLSVIMIIAIYCESIMCVKEKKSLKI